MRLPTYLLLLAALPLSFAVEAEKAMTEKAATAEKPAVAREMDAPKDGMKGKMDLAEGDKPAPKPKMPEETEKPKTEAEAKKPDAEMKKKEETEKPKEEEGPTIAPFRPAKLPSAKESRTFKLANLNKPLAFETTRELQRLFGAFTTQYVADGQGFARAPGPVASVSYTILQDLGDNRYVAKASWPAVGDVLASSTDVWAILLLDQDVKVGATGRMVGTHAGTVALTFTAKFSPIDGKALTLRREAFVECKAIEESNANLAKFIEQIGQGADLSVTTTDKVACKTCNGLGYTREAQKGKLEDKRIPCTQCEATGKLTVSTETKFIP